MRNYNTMLHMKLNSAVCLTALLAFLPSSAFAGICFLPDCMDEDVLQGDFNMNVNEDTEFCEKEGYTYYSSGECPQYYAKIGTCSRDDHYLKCDAATWCKNNGYNTTSCSLPSFVDGQCPNGQPYYKQCKEDRPRACREQGYVNSCSPGRLYATSNRCPWDSSYGKCCTASPSSGCPSNYGVDCDASRGSSGVDNCGYTCYRCCSDTCSRGSKNYSGSYASTTECGSTCYYCKDCTSGSTSYSGDYAGTSECGTCYYCDDNCRTGSKSVSCSSTENKVRVSSTECGSSCYECQYNTDCNATDKSCPYGCASYNSCSKCTSCKSCSNTCSTGSTSSSCSTGYTAKAVGTTQCGNTCYSCEQDCTYSYTAASCSSQCKNVGSSTCVRNGTIYYQSCGSSKCSSNQTCNNGTCKASIKGTYTNCCTIECDIGGCKYGADGTLCYQECRSYYPDCNDWKAQCSAEGGSIYPIGGSDVCRHFQYTYDGTGDAYWTFGYKIYSCN